MKGVASAGLSSFALMRSGNPVRQNYPSFPEMGQKSSSLGGNGGRTFVCYASGAEQNRNHATSPRRRKDRLPKPHRVDLLLDLPPVNQETQEFHAWNPVDRSLNIFVKDEDPTTIHRHPVAQSTDCVRGRVGYSNGVHAWRITWSMRQRGTHAVVGVAEITAPVHAYGYSSVVGSTSDSWGWDIGRKRLYHADSNNNNSDPYPLHDVKANEEMTIPDSFVMILDMDAGTLAFVVDDEYMGVAFHGLKGKTLYPIVNVVWGHAEVSYKYLGGLAPEPVSLAALCRRTIRSHVGDKNLANVSALPLPSAIQEYIAS